MPSFTIYNHNPHYLLRKECFSDLDRKQVWEEAYKSFVKPRNVLAARKITATHRLVTRKPTRKFTGNITIVTGTLQCRWHDIESCPPIFWNPTPPIPFDKYRSGWLAMRFHLVMITGAGMKPEQGIRRERNTGQKDKNRGRE